MRSPRSHPAAGILGPCRTRSSCDTPERHRGPVSLRFTDASNRQRWLLLGYQPTASCGKPLNSPPRGMEAASFDPQEAFVQAASTHMPAPHGKLAVLPPPPSPCSCVRRGGREAADPPGAVPAARLSAGASAPRMHEASAMATVMRVARTPRCLAIVRAAAPQVKGVPHAAELRPGRLASTPAPCSASCSPLALTQPAVLHPELHRTPALGGRAYCAEERGSNASSPHSSSPARPSSSDTISARQARPGRPEREAHSAQGGSRRRP
jgi:hypothetical protein